MKIKRKGTPSRVNSKIKGSWKEIRLTLSRNPENGKLSFECPVDEKIPFIKLRRGVSICITDKGKPSFGSFPKKDARRPDLTSRCSQHIELKPRMAAGRDKWDPSGTMALEREVRHPRPD